MGFGLSKDFCPYVSFTYNNTAGTQLLQQSTMDYNNTANLYHYFDNKVNVSERTKYKYFTERDSRILELKSRVDMAVAKRGLSSFMNDTKWLELQAAIPSLPFPPPYTERLILDAADTGVVEFSKIPEFTGDWSPFYEEGMSFFFEIEWMKISPRYAEYRGALVEPKIFDETRELEQLLIAIGIPYEYANRVFTIFGYK